MAFKEIRLTLLVKIDFLANSPNFSHTKLSSFTVLDNEWVVFIVSVFIKLLMDGTGLLPYSTKF